MRKGKIVGIIPSRLKSSRISNKPLIDIHGLPMVVHVYKRALQARILDDLYVATDSIKIKDVIQENGGKAIITSRNHRNGTERIAEAVQNLNYKYVVLINGDEALLNPDHIKISVDALIKSDADASLLVNEFKIVDSPSDFKVVLNQNDEVMYISRGDIPCAARNTVDKRLKAYHILTFKKEFLRIYATLPKGPLERIEDHEHLRIIEHGYTIKAVQVDSTAISVDTSDDLSYVREAMSKDQLFQQYKNN